MAKETKENIYRAFNNLIKQNGLDHVTVADLVNEANINRKTFYYHYDGIDFLISEMLTDALKREIGDKTAISNWKEGFASCFECFLMERSFIDEIVHSRYKSLLHSILKDVSLEMIGINLKEVLEEYRRSNNPEYGVFVRDFDEYSELYSSLILSVFETWIDKGMNKDYQKYVEFIYLLFADSIYGVIPKLK